MADITITGTKADIGLGNVDNTSDASKPVSTAQATAIAVVMSALSTHAARTDNPHSVTKTQVGLGNVPDVDTTNPANITQSASYRFTTDAEKATWNALIGGSIFQTTWNATTNTPALASGTGTKGFYYIVATAGGTNLDGITSWNIGDWAIFDGTVWRKVDNTDAVSSVNSLTGAVVLDTSNVADTSNKRYVTDAQLTVLGNTSNTNTGDETAARIGAIVNAAANYTTPLDADKIGIWDTLNSLFKAVTLANIKATFKTYFDTLYASADAWVAINATLTYSSADDPTFVISSNADLTAILSVGMKIKFTNNSTTFYGFITAIGAWSGSAQLITVYGGTDYDVANSAITLPYYSSGKVPFGFPITPAKWEVLVTDTTARSTPTPTATVWYNTGTETIVLPIGVWNVMVKGTMFQNGIANDLAMTLSTANNSESDAKNTIKAAVAATGVNSIPVNLMSRITVATKTTHYLNLKTDAAAVTSIGWQNGTYGTLVISAVNSNL